MPSRARDLPNVNPPTPAPMIRTGGVVMDDWNIFLIILTNQGLLFPSFCFSFSRTRPKMFRLSLLFSAFLGFSILNIGQCFVLQSSASLSPGFLPSQGSSCSSIFRTAITKSWATKKIGTLQLKETKTCFGSRGLKPSPRVNLFSTLLSSVASATDKWEVLEQFQSTAEMDYFIVGDAFFISNACKYCFEEGAWCAGLGTAST
jgi:hypothetical protein